MGITVRSMDYPVGLMGYAIGADKLSCQVDGISGWAGGYTVGLTGYVPH